MSRSDNTAPYRVRKTALERRKAWRGKATRREIQARAANWWKATRAAERDALRTGSEAGPARARSRAIYRSW